MSKRSVLALLVMCLFFQAGCSIIPFKRVLVYSDISRDNTLPLFDPNAGPVKMVILDKAIRVYQKPIVELNKPCRVKYKPFYFDHYPNIMVTGRILSGKEYMVMIDSGSSDFISITDNIVSENKLPIYPLEKAPRGGLCHLPYLQIGKARIYNAPCTYNEQHWEFQMFGIPIYQARQVFVGLMVMKEFRYILFDNIKREVEFSAEASFTPSQPGHWSQYPFCITKDTNNYFRLMVTIPIENEDVDIMFDTGSGEGLIVHPALWSRLSKRVKTKNISQDKLAMFQYGWVACQKVVTQSLSIGNIFVEDAPIFVLPEDTPCRIPSNIGMRCFKNTIFVLDFERNLLWIKNREVNKK